MPDEEQRIGNYRLLGELGRGGQATVYQARDDRIERDVALKVLDWRIAQDQTAIARLRREAEIASRLQHPAICPIHEVGLDGPIPFIAMEFIDGEPLARKIYAAANEVLKLDSYVSLTSPSTPPSRSLSEVLRKPEKHDEDPLEVVLLFEKLAMALHYAHEAGVVHRDIKPSNIMITRQAEPVILDFGLAYDEESDGVSLTNTGSLTGTPAYMSPEQIAAKRIRLDRRTDIFSLGVSMYECLTLRRPFDSLTREGLYQAIMTKPAADPRRTNPRISASLKAVLDTAMEKDRDRRYETSLAFAEDLGRVRAGQKTLAKPLTPLRRATLWAAKNPLAVGNLFGSLIAGVLLVELAWRPVDPGLILLGLALAYVTRRFSRWRNNAMGKLAGGKR